MAKDMNCVIAGFGGQGSLFMGKVIAYAGLIDGKEVSWFPSYGPEMRGGTANCSVCVSDEPICSPLVNNPNALIVMNLPSFDKFIDTVVPGGVVVIDSSLVAKKCSREDISVHYIPATKLADEAGLNGLANIVLLGKLLKESGFSTVETMQKTIEKVVPARKQHLIPKNMEAIELGMNN